MKIISIIIPVYNEQTYVGALLQKVAALDFSAEGYEKEIVIVNDGSKDNSKAIIHEFINSYKGKTQYLEHTNAGKGYSIKQGVKHAVGDIYLVQDADLEYDPEDIHILLKNLEEKNLDICYGSRTLGYFVYGAKYSTLLFFAGGICLSLLTTIVTFRLVTDEPTCYKMYRKRCKDLLLAPKENDFAWEPAVTVSLLKKGFTYGEKPIHYYPRKHQQGKKIKLIDGWKAIKAIFAYAFH